MTIDTVGLTYDALGRMVEQNRAGVYTQVLYSPVGKTAIMNGQTRKTINLPLPGGATAVYDTTFHYRYSDWLGSSRFSSTTSRTKFSDDAYAPYGENYAESGTVDPSFTGNDQDTVSGTYDFLFREYNANQGRWISPDPAGLGVIDLRNPQTWNRYAYVANNPLGAVDPLGLTDCPQGKTCPIPVPPQPPVNVVALPPIVPGVPGGSVPVIIVVPPGRECFGCGLFIGHVPTPSEPNSQKPGTPPANNGPDPGAVANSMNQYVKAQTSNCYNGFHQTTAGRVVQAFSALALFPVANNAQSNQLALGAEFLGKVSVAAGSKSAGGEFAPLLGELTSKVTTPLYTLGTDADAGALLLCSAGAATSIVP